MLGSAAINLVGNSLANELSGNSASNILLGGGGNDFLSGNAGADVMRGGTGNDGYNVDDAGDVIIENPGEGTDLVRSTVSIVLAENLENVILGGPSNNPPEIFAAGNALDNSMIGNGADNILNGRGGEDRMFGYGGNDTYVVDSAGDLVGEVANNGIDTVLTAVSRGILEANVEHLTMIGTGNINGSGNEDNNVIRGNDGFNVINGREGNDTILAGLGRDTQYGGKGNDTFVFNSTAESGPSSLQRDRIADFGAGDHIHLLAIDADETTAGNQAFVLDTNGSFSAGEIRQTQFGSNLLLEMNTDADAAAEMSLLLLNSGFLDAGDFVL
jgi:Ca2+-binding RTX toxin-like protein